VKGVYNNMETIKIGRREVNKDQFINAVANSNSLTQIIESIGFNPIPTTTRMNVVNTIEQMQLNTSHIKCLKRYANPEVVQKRIKTFKLSKPNQMYLDRFISSLSEQSRASYKSSCGNFLQEIGTNDFARVSPDRIMKFVNKKNSQAQKNNTAAHIRSMMMYVVSNNINNAKETVSKDMLIWLISK
jgi:hypothetical protein